MPDELNILIVEDSEDDAELMRLQLQAEGFQLHWKRVDREADFRQALHPQPQVILSDWSLPQFSGLRALEIINEQTLDIPFVIVSGNIGEEAAFAAVRLGAYDYVLKGRMKRLGPAVRHALEQKKLKDERERAERSEQALYLSEQHLRRIFENSTVGVVSVTLDQKFYQANPTFCGMLGYTEKELYQLTFEQVFLPEDRETSVRLFTHLIQGASESFELENEYLRKDGSSGWAQINLSIVRDRDGQPIHVVALVGDISERRRAETLLKESEERYRGLVNASPTGILVVQHGNYTFANPAGAMLLGYSAQEIVGLSLFKTIHPDCVELVKKRIQHIESGQSNLPVEMKIVRKDGSPIFTESISVPITLNGEPATLILCNDITSRKQAEETIQRQTRLLDSIREAQAQYIAGKDEREVFQSLASIMVAATGTQVGRLDELVKLPNGNQQLTTLATIGMASIGFDELTSSPPGETLPKHFIRQTLLNGPQIPIDRVVVYRDTNPEENGIRFPEGHPSLHSYMGIPLFYGGEQVGLAGLANLPTEFSEELAEQFELFMNTCAGIIAAFRKDRAEQAALEALNDANDEAIEGWSQAMDLRDRETEGHSLRVTEMTLRLAQRLGISGMDLIHIRRGALLHDMGKLGIPDEILLKPGKLDAREWEIMKQHPTLGFQMLSKIKFLQPALGIPYSHHEKWDGSGYPQRLKGKEIPLIARVFAPCDVWDALTNPRPYRPAWERREAFDYICKEGGQHFDPQVVAVFREEITSGGYLDEL